MDFVSLLDLAQRIAALGVAGTLALVVVLFLTGKLHADPEVKRDGDYREALRREAAEDRRAADDRVDKLAESVKESNELSRRALDLLERAIERIPRDSPSAR